MASVTPLGNNKYRVIISNGYNGAGKRKRVTKTITETSQERANIRGEELEKEYKNGKDYSFTRKTVNDLIDIYTTFQMALDREDDGVRYAISTIVRNRNTIKELQKNLGQYRLIDFNTFYVEEYITSLSMNGARRDGKSGGLSGKTIKNRLDVLSQICKYGVHIGWLEKNPCLDVKKPKLKKKAIKSYHADEVKNIMQSLKGEDIKHRVAIEIALCCGVRRGELMGLEWKDFDFEKRTVRIERASQYVPKQGTMETALKTEASNRIIAIPKELVDSLQKYKQWQENEKVNAEELWYESDRLFVNEFGKPLNPDSISQWFERFLKRNDIRVLSFHKLRHTNISMLIANNLDAVSVSQRAGHSNITTTLNIYSHLYKKVDYQSVDIISNEVYK